MEIIKGIGIVDLALFIREQKTLVISDLHIGYEEELNKKGFLVPRMHFKDTIERLDKIIQKTQPETIIINGDLKHEFGSISEQEWRDTIRLIDYLAKHSKKIILIKGNHDTILGPIAKKREVEVVNNFAIQLKNKTKIFFCHGDKIPKEKRFEDSNIVIIGHEHSAITISDSIRQEKYKCFLVGKWKLGIIKKSKTLIVLPSFNLVTEGTDIKQGRLLSPFLKDSILEFKVYISNQESVMDFGKIKNIK